MDWIELTDLRLECIVGILDRERVTPQPLEMEVRLGLDLDGAAAGDLSASVDYAAVLDQVRFLALEGRWYLIESLAGAACRLLLAPPASGEARAQVEVVELSLRKPDILGGAAVPGIRVHRALGWSPPGIRGLAQGVRAEVLQEDGHTGAYRILLDEGARWAPPEELAIHVLSERAWLAVSRPPLT